MPIVPRPCPVGQTFGSWTVLGEAAGTPKNRYFRCRCACGKESEIAASALRNGKSGSCSRFCPARPPEPDRIEPGTRFGRLVTLGPSFERRGRRYYACACDCGNQHGAYEYNLLSGNTLSCGCLRSEVTTRRSTTHGGACGKLYWVWSALIQRCENPKNKDFEHYGARGIRVCDEWHDFAEFQAWALANGYREGLEIDRAENDGPYSPGNCRFITHQQNCQNRRRRRWAKR